MIVKNEKPNLFHVGGLRLMPGLNVLDVFAWAKVREHPSVQKRLDLGLITEESGFEEELERMKGLGAEDESKETSDLAKEEALGHLKELKQNQAKLLVEATTDLFLLEGWLKREDRNIVKGYLKKQLETMKAPVEKRDRGQTRQITTGKEPEVIQVKATPSSEDD